MNIEQVYVCGVEATRILTPNPRIALTLVRKEGRGSCIAQLAPIQDCCSPGHTLAVFGRLNEEPVLSSQLYEKSQLTRALVLRLLASAHRIEHKSLALR